MKKRSVFYILFALVLLAATSVAAYATGDGPGDPPDPEGDPPVCEEGDITVEDAQWECTLVEVEKIIDKDASIRYVCPDGYHQSVIHHDKCVKGPIWDLEYTDKVPENYCPNGWDLEGETCYKTIVVQEWECGWEGPVCRQREEVVVGVSLSCGREAGDGLVYQTYAKITVEPNGGATLTFDGMDYTESTTAYASFKSYDWSAVAADGYSIVGDSEGTVKMKESECNGPPPSQDGAGGPGMLPLIAWALTGSAALGLAGLSFAAWRRRS